MCARVTDVMTTDVVTVEQTASLETVAEQLLTHGIGSVVVTDGGSPFGIITETDVILTSYRRSQPLEEIPARVATSHPLETVEPTQSVRLVVKRMQDEGLKKLVVVDDLEVQGIVTTTDLIDHFGELTSELSEIRRNSGWSEDSL